MLYKNLARELVAPETPDVSPSLPPTILGPSFLFCKGTGETVWS